MALTRGKINSFLNVIIAICIVLECNSVYARTGSKEFFYILCLFPVLLSVIFNCRNIRMNLRRNSPLYILLFVLMMIVLSSFAFNIKSLILRLGIVFPTILSYFVLLNKRKNKLSIFYTVSDIIYIISIISVPLWLTVSILKIIPTNMGLSIDWGGVHDVRGFMGLYFETQMIGDFYRNTAIFSEAPMFSFMLSFAIVIELFYKKSVAKRKLLILIITTLTTLSTTGYIALLLMLGFVVYTRRSTNKLWQFLKLGSLPFLIFLLYLLLVQLVREKAESGTSYNTRTENIQHSVSRWSQSPLFGDGYGSTMVETSNSIFIILSDGGIALAIFYIIPLVFIPWLFSIKHKNNKYIIGALVFFFTFSVTIVYSNFIVFFFMSLWYSMLINRQNLIKEN